jgi:hypothetical protein
MAGLQWSRRIALATVAPVLAMGAMTACGGGSSFNAASAKTEITKNWQNFFDSKQPVASRTALLQDSASLSATLAAQAKNPQAQGSSAKVTKVEIASSHKTATVTYNILANGSVALSDASGTAVLVSGKWLVSKQTFCTLLKLGANGQAVPGCS